MNVPWWRKTARIWSIPLLAFLLIPLIAYGASHAMQSNANSPVDWVPPTFPLKGEYDSFVDKFGPGDAVLVSWDGCTADNPQLDTLLQAIRNAPCFHDSLGKSYFHRVVSGREVLQQLTHSILPVPQEEVERSLQGSLLGPDGRQTCVIVFFTADGRRNRAALVTALESQIESTCHVSPQEVHLAGPIIDGLRVDEAGKAALDHLAIPSALIVLLSACVALRDWRLGVLVFGISVYCQGATLALVYLCGETMSVLLIVLPPLIQILAVAGGIHLVNYYRESVRDVGRQQAPWQAIHLGWFPCLLSAATTAIGIGSLAATHLTPIRLFGMLGAMGVSLTAGILLTVLPAMLLLCGKKQETNMESRLQISSFRGSTFWQSLTIFLKRRSSVVILMFLVVLVSGGLGMSFLKSSVRIETLFPENSRIVRDSRWLEAHIGPLVTIDVVVSVPAVSQEDGTQLPVDIVRNIDRDA